MATNKAKQAAELLDVLVVDEGMAHTRELAGAVAELVDIATSLGRYNELACNQELTDRQIKRNDKLESRATAIIYAWGYDWYVNTDPRGYAVYVRGLKSGRYNSMGGREHGWGVG